MGGVGSGRKPAGVGKVRVAPGIALVEGGAEPPAAREVALALGPLVEEFATALELCETPEARAAFGTRTRRGKLWRSPVYRRAAMVALSACGLTQVEIGDVLGLEAGSVAGVLYRMRKAGVGVDTEARLDHGIIPDAIEALHADVRDKSSPGHQKAYLAALSGRGALRVHRDPAETAAGGVAVLNVKFEMPADGRVPTMNGQIVGVPRGRLLPEGPS